MSIIGRLMPIHGGLVAVCLAVGLLIALALGFRSFSGGGELRKIANALVEQPLPKRPPIIVPESSELPSNVAADEQSLNDLLANPAFTQPETNEVKPAAPDLDLVDASPSGPLPRISTDGRLPLLAYRRPFDLSDKRPKVGIMIAGLGPQADATNATFHLPAPFSLSFSPYTEDLPSLFERARLAGHEVLLELPMEPVDYPASDPGPYTLRASGTVDANIERLIWILSRAPGYFAVTGAAGAFGGSQEAGPIVEAIAAKGVGLIEIDGDRLGDQAEEAGLAYMSALQWIDEIPSIEAIDRALAGLEAKAKTEGTAIGVAEAYPVTLQRLIIWSAELDSRGIALVPASTILIERNDQLGADIQSSGSSLAQSQN